MVSFLCDLPPLAQACVLGLLLDVLVGDPQVRWHPIRLLGNWSLAVESLLRACSGAGRIAGCMHVCLVAALPVVLWWCGQAVLAQMSFGPAAHVSEWLLIIWDSFFIWAALSNRDLIAHAVRIESALRLADLALARQRLARCVGRDTDHLAPAGIRRATIEMVSESMVDGVAMPLFWLALGGIPGLLLAKSVSTLDSMVGYRNERYVKYGWASARMDDVMNWLPARLLLVVLMFVLAWRPLRAWSALRTAWRWHALLPSPNSGWSEAAYAGALQVRLLGPIHVNNVLVNEVFMGDSFWPDDPGSTGMRRCIGLSIALMLALATLALVTMYLMREWTWFV